MSSLGVFKQQARRLAAVAALLVATIMPALVPALAAAETTATGRSIVLSSSSKKAKDVTYGINFTATTDAAAFVVDFCSDSPVIGQACTPPTGFSASTADTSTSGFTVTQGTSKVIVAGAIDHTVNTGKVSVDLTGITNPDNAGPLYARIVTFDTTDHANAYTSETPGTGIADEGSVAVSITDTFGVSGAVLESMTFCLSGEDITEEGCGGTLTSPVLKLGETVGSTKALSSSVVSTGLVYTQISTNAVSGAVINLKSGTSCGGMKRAEATGCDIAPALTGDVTAGHAQFGVKTATATSVGSVANGTFEPVTGSGYNNSTYALNYLANNTSGVTSVYGDPFLDTAGAPVNNKNMQLTFGASISNDTPAGSYSADLSMIATGKF